MFIHTQQWKGFPGGVHLFNIIHTLYDRTAALIRVREVLSATLRERLVTHKKIFKLPAHKIPVFYSYKSAFHNPV